MVEPARSASSLLRRRRGRRPPDPRAQNIRSNTAIDSLFDSLLWAVCDTSGRSGTRTRQTTEYVSHALASRDTSRQGRSISS